MSCILKSRLCHGIAAYQISSKGTEKKKDLNWDYPDHGINLQIAHLFKRRDSSLIRSHDWQNIPIVQAVGQIDELLRQNLQQHQLIEMR